MHNAFALVLEDLLDAVPGAVGAIFADWEGEAVDHVSSLDADEIKLIGAHWGIILSLSAQAPKLRERVGAICEIVIECEKWDFVIRPVTDRYFVVLTLGHDAQLGRAQLELARYAKELYERM